MDGVLGTQSQKGHDMAFLGDELPGAKRKPRPGVYGGI